MNNVFLYTFPQYFVFAALFVSIYGWVENKKSFRMIGISLFILLGLYALGVLMENHLDPGSFLTPEEIASEELDDEIINEIPMEKKLFPAYLSFILASLFALPCLIFEWKNKKGAKILLVFTALIALAGFFTIVGAVRSF